MRRADPRGSLPRTGGSPKEINSMRFHRYTDARGQWRWRLWSANNRILADSGQGYDSLADCDHAIALVQQSYNAALV
jgi:uncharacterized protein YegP (UPF0339 family)